MAVGVAKVTAAPSAAVAEAVTVLPTVTVKEDAADRPASSAAVHVTVVVPGAKVDPDGGTHVTGTVPYIGSVALTLYWITSPLGPVADTSTLGERVSVGGAEELTVTVKLPRAVSPDESGALAQLTVVVPSGNVLPDV